MGEAANHAVSPPSIFSIPTTGKDSIMSKTKTFRVDNGRLLFKCQGCQSKRMITVPQGIRLKSIRCNKCGEIIRSVFNRRQLAREQQGGSVWLTTSDGRELLVDLYDISPNGVGFDLSTRDINKLTIGRDVRFRCPWNPKLFSNARYVVRSIHGQRIGAERRT